MSYSSDRWYWLGTPRLQGQSHSQSGQAGTGPTGVGSVGLEGEQGHPQDTGTEARQWAGFECVFVTLKHSKEWEEQRGALVRSSEMGGGAGMTLPWQSQRALGLGGR